MKQKQKPKVVLFVWIPPHVKEALREAAKRRGLTMTAFIVEAIMEKAKR